MWPPLPKLTTVTDQTHMPSVINWIVNAISITALGAALMWGGRYIERQQYHAAQIDSLRARLAIIENRPTADIEMIRRLTTIEERVAADQRQQTEFRATVYQSLGRIEKDTGNGK